MTIYEMRKEDVCGEFIAMIRKSWTYERLCDNERKKIEQIISNACDERYETHVFGTVRQRWQLLHGLYSAFLDGCGYSWEGWREKTA